MTADIRQYAAAVRLWEQHRRDTVDIARVLGITEATAARLIANWRDMAARGNGSAS